MRTSLLAATLSAFPCPFFHLSLFLQLDPLEGVSCSADSAAWQGYGQHRSQGRVESRVRAVYKELSVFVMSPTLLFLFPGRTTCENVQAFGFGAKPLVPLTKRAPSSG